MLIAPDAVFAQADLIVKVKEPLGLHYTDPLEALAA